MFPPVAMNLLLERAVRVFASSCEAPASRKMLLEIFPYWNEDIGLVTNLLEGPIGPFAFLGFLIAGRRKGFS